MRSGVFRVLVVAVGVILVAASCASPRQASTGTASTGTAGHAPEQITSAYARLPVRFEANRGQAGPGVDFVARGQGFTAQVGATETLLSVGGGKGTVAMRLVGADPAARARSGRALPGTTNYLSGADRSSWLVDVPSYASVTYANAYPGVDMVYRSASSGLKYDFVVAPGADPGRIALAFDRKVRIDDAGDLVIPTPAGPVRHEKPVVYQEVAGRHHGVAATYVLDTAGDVGFDLGRYDSRRPLVIDPAVVYSTFIGGPLGDAVNGIAVDSAGQAYVAGSTTSTDFPTANALQVAKGAGTTNDAFVAKFNAAGNALVYSTYLGGALADVANAIAIDSAGNAFVTGSTASANFPTAAAFQAANAGSATNDAFVTKLNPAGNGLVYSTYLGGGAADAGFGIAVDGAGNASVAGITASTNFPTAVAFQAALGAGTCPTAACTDGFVTRLNAAGSALTYSTYLGGNGDDSVASLALDGAGNVYVAGSTASSNYPTASPFQAAIGGGGSCGTTAFPGLLCTDAFVTKIPPAGAPLTYSTYLGGSLADAGSGVAVDAGGAAYVTGAVSSTNFPTATAFQATKGAGTESDAFVTKLSASGSSLVYSTYLGGSEFDTGRAIAVDATGSAHVSGMADSELFPVVRPVARLAGNEEAFIARFDPTGTSLVFSTHYGGIGTDDARAIAVDAAQSTYFAGLTTFARIPEYFPTVNAFQATFGGGFVPGTPNSGDGFLAKMTADIAGRPLVTRLTSRGGDVAGGSSVVIEGFNLSGATSVRFGDTAARSFAVASDRRVVAVSPALAEGIHKVTVTTAAGTSPANPIAEFWAGEGSWELTGSLNTARSAQTATLLNNGQVLVVGGRVGAASTTPVASAELYDPINGTWHTTGSLAVGRWSHTATLLGDGRVLVAGGYSSSTAIVASAELYDPATGTWKTAAPMANARAIHVGALLRGPNCASRCGKVLVAGGRTTTTVTTSTTELYDPQRDSWETAGNLNEGRYLTEAAVMGDSRVLIAGGFAVTDTAETFDPRTGEWSYTANPMSFAKARATVTALPDGNVLVNNGWSNGPVPASDVFDYRTNSFKRAGTPKTHRWNASAVLLPNGRVLALAGGVGGATADIYDPKSNDFRSAGSLQIARGALPGTGGGVGGTAVVLSSSTTEFQADQRVCGQNCGKVLILGNSDDPVTELYTAAAPPGGPGYWMVASDGGVFAFGDARFLGSTGAIRLNKPMVGMAAAPSGQGYWMVASDGGVFAFGDARFLGSTGALALNSPIVGMARTPTGRGYWLTASDGGVFAFGDAQFLGSTGAATLNRPVVGMTSTPTGRGYWLVASDGGIFAFGDAKFLGSTGATRLNRPVVGMAPTVNGQGYWLVASDGGVFAFGDATFRGSTGAIRLNQPVVGMAPTASPLVAGYWLVASDGGVFAFGDARFAGSTGAIRLNKPMVGMAANPPTR